MSAHPRLQLAQIDAFTDRPFAGNPAAVCVPPEGLALSDESRLAVAREMNLSETAFLARRVDGDWDLRWFTPGAEVDLCGHATLASAHHLWETGLAPSDEAIRFHTRSGVLTATWSATGEENWIELDFPAQPAEASEAPAGLLEALGVQAEWVGTNGTDWLVEVCGEATVRSAEPDLSALGRMPARGVILTAAAADPTAGYDFVSRFFAPAFGVPEDPVTGSAHCCLAPHWTAKLGRNPLVGFQASTRGGFVRAYLDGDRVRLGGQAVSVLTAEMIAPAGTGGSAVAR